MGRAKSAKQMKTTQYLVLCGVPGARAAVIGAAAYDQRNLDPAFRPIVSERQAFGFISDWIVAQTPNSIPVGGSGASREAIRELEEKLFGPRGLDGLPTR